MKGCTTCNKLKPYSDFYKSRTYKDGYGYRCKECDNAAGKAYRELHKDKHSKLNSIRNRRHKYGIEPEAYQELIKNGCEICGSKIGRMCVDHCHITGIVRGALCVRCNAGLGQFLDNTESLANAIIYIRKFHNKQYH